MSMGDSSTSPFSGWRITQESYHGNPRYFRVNRTAIFKTIRVENEVRVFEEILNELVCVSIARELEVPVAESSLGELAGRGLGVYSILLGEEFLNPSDSTQHAKIVNYSKLKDLFVFDQFVINDDRRPDHIIVSVDSTNPDLRFLYGIDQGHTLNGYKGQKWTSSVFGDAEASSVAPVNFDSGVTNVDEVDPCLRRIESLTDSEIARLVYNSVITISECKISREEFVRVENDAPIITKILVRRKAKIRQIIGTWCEQRRV